MSHQPTTGNQAIAPGRLLVAREVAALLAVPESWVREATREGRIPHLRLGRYCRYREHEIHNWLDAQTAGPGSPASKRGKRP
jgi:excisionase family DNA binding protein